MRRFSRVLQLVIPVLAVAALFAGDIQRARAQGRTRIVVPSGIAPRGELPPGLLEAMPSRMSPAVPGAPTQKDKPTVPTDPAEAKAKAERLKKIKKLKFDRRPSAILKAWANPPKTPEEKEKERLEKERLEKEKAAKEKKAADAKAAADKAKQPAGSEAKKAAAASGSPVKAPPGEAASKADDKKEPAGEGDQESENKPQEPTKPKTAEELEAEKVAAKAAAEAKKKADEAKKKAEEAAKKKAEADKKRAEAMKKFDEDIKLFVRNVTLGQWDDVETFLKSLGKDEAKAAYAQMMASLVKGPGNRNSRMAAYAEGNVFSTADILALARICPHKIETAQESQLAGIIRQSLKTGNVMINIMVRLRELKADPKTSPLTNRQIARILMACAHPVEAGEFLPSVEQAAKDDDREGFNLLSRHYLALFAKEKKKEHLEKAWNVTQSALAQGKVEDKAKQEALVRAVELAPRIREELGQAWLDESFTERPKRGMEVLATVGEAVAAGMEVRSTDAAFRLRALTLQNTAVNALLTAAPKRALEWKKTLVLLATNWLREAEHSHKFDQNANSGPRMQRDIYGNYFWNNTARPYSPAVSSRRPRPIETAKLLEIRPQEKWLALIPDEYRPKFAMVIPQLLLKAEQEEEAFPHIERLAQTHPDQARQLVEEFLRVWIKNHDPNATRNRTNYYMFSYGFNNRANSIPLTRSKQDRNLKELSGWLTRLKKLPIGEIDEKLLTQAFTAVHSQAEVYRLDAVEKVFGGVGSLKAKTLAQLIQNMRANLLTVWRSPEVQKKAGTNRRKKDIQQEVLRGYAVARMVLNDGLKKYPNDWSMLLAKASIAHDQNSYQNDIKHDSRFTSRRQAAFADFARAAAAYGKLVDKEAAEDKYTTQAFETWFYASLGAVDLGAITEEMQPDFRQHAVIKKAIETLPGDAAERHMAMFANSLFTRMSSLNPAVKFRYLKAGLNIVGDHPRAAEARKVFDYYKDLVTEIKLDAVIDGPDSVGHQEPFGVFINIRHTKQIERESGGFAKYLQNQNNMYYSYNYGRPTENYRDKFEETVEKAWKEHFEVLSVTFQKDNVNSRATAVPGWRVTPYSYVLVKARGPEVDKLPPVRIDFDFLDTSGYAVIPVATPALPLDAAEKGGGVRPYRGLQITQTLDERQADEGKLVLEIKARALGLIPSLEEIVDLRPEGFEIAKNEDQGVSVTRFDPDSADNVVQSERTWLLTMQTAAEAESRPTTFQFASARSDDAEVIYQRYDDADLASVGQSIELEEKYEVASQQHWLIYVLVGVPLFVVLCVVMYVLNRTQPKTVTQGFRMPEPVTPFTVIGLLRDIQLNNGLTKSGKEELSTSINRLEDYYFSKDEGPEPDLESIARSWVGKAR